MKKEVLIYKEIAMKTMKLEDYLNLDYAIEVEIISPEDGGGILMYMPELGKDSCLGDGENFDEAYKNLKKSQQSIITYALEKGIDIPLPAKIQYEDFSGKFLMRLPKELHYRLALEAKDNGISLNSWVNYLLTKASGNIDIKKICDTIDKKFSCLSINSPHLQNLNGKLADYAPKEYAKAS